MHVNLRLVLSKRQTPLCPGLCGTLLKSSPASLTHSRTHSFLHTTAPGPSEEEPHCPLPRLWGPRTLAKHRLSPAVRSPAGSPGHSNPTYPNPWAQTPSHGREMSGPQEAPPGCSRSRASGLRSPVPWGLDSGWGRGRRASLRRAEAGPCCPHHLQRPAPPTTHGASPSPTPPLLHTPHQGWPVASLALDFQGAAIPISRLRLRQQDSPGVAELGAGPSQGGIRVDQG